MWRARGCSLHRIAMQSDVDPSLRSGPLDYASPELPRPERTTRLIIALLLAFLALGAAFIGIVIYMSWID